jgi:L-ascorbate metabolism protein UlaG (beta-lactamase superfamily)
MSFEFNAQLKFIKSDWNGNPVSEKGLFSNIEYPFEARFSDLWKWQRETNLQKAEKKASNFKLITEAITQQDFHKVNTIIWFGHASFFLNLNGIKILIDPVLFDVSFLVKRKSELPIAIEDIKDLDYIFISHDHRDHLDEKSLKLLSENNPQCKYITGLRIDELIQKFTKATDITTMGWYQQLDLSHEIKISYLPTRHWSKRGLLDTNKRLWGSFFIQVGKQHIYFGGDSGYGNHFAEVKSLFGHIDIAMLGIGAYKPEWFMSPSHTSPTLALKAAEDLDAKIFIPMHYGTFDLSDEPLHDPIQTLQTLKKPDRMNVLALNIGKIFQF